MRGYGVRGPSDDVFIWFVDRDRYQTFRQKFMTLNCMHGTGKLWEDLGTVRADVATETASMARRKLLMNYYWSGFV